MGFHFGLYILSILNFFFILSFGLLGSSIIKASELPDLTAKAIFLLSGDQVIPGFKICNSSISDVTCAETILFKNSPVNKDTVYIDIPPSLFE